MGMPTHSQPKTKPSITELLPIFKELLPVKVIQKLVHMVQKNYYNRIFTPIVLVWCLIYQRLNNDHTCEAVVSHLSSGKLDYFDEEHTLPLSQRIKSSSTAAYCKGRQRLPLSILQGAISHAAQVIQQWPGSFSLWLGHHVALTDGTTILLKPEPELVKHYGRHKNQHGESYWVIMRVLVAFCLTTGAILGVIDGSLHTSEQLLCVELFAQAIANSVYVGDANFGIFSVVQAACHYNVWVVLRVTRSRACALAKNNKKKLYPNSDIKVKWSPSPYDQIHPNMSIFPIEGRLIYVKLQRPGFRPIDLYLFTTLLDANRYTVEELVKLYSLRWHVELNLRYVKDTLEMGLLTSKSVDMVRKELFAGMLAYNIIRGFMVKSALQANLPPLELSFTRCWRYIWSTLLTIRPTDSEQYVIQVFQMLLIRLARCKLPKRHYFRMEPRAVHRRPAVYPNLKCSRAEARQHLLLLEVSMKS